VPPDRLEKIPPERRKGLPKKGDVTLSFIDAHGQIAYQKVLRRVV
jgi:hypothetical protein